MLAVAIYITRVLHMIDENPQASNELTDLGPDARKHMGNHVHVLNPTWNSPRKGWLQRRRDELS